MPHCDHGHGSIGLWTEYENQKWVPWGLLKRLQTMDLSICSECASIMPFRHRWTSPSLHLMKNHTHQFLNSGHPNLDYWMTKCLPRLREPGTGLHTTQPVTNIQETLQQASHNCKQMQNYTLSILRFLSCKHVTCLHLHVRDSVHSVIGKVQSLSALRERVWPWTSILTPRNERKQRGPYFLQLCECGAPRIKFSGNVPAPTWTCKFHVNVSSWRSHVTYMDMTKFESLRYDWIEELVARIVRLEQ